jgi:hypothetical protein
VERSSVAISSGISTLGKFQFKAIVLIAASAFPISSSNLRRANDARALKEGQAAYVIPPGDSEPESLMRTDQRQPRANFTKVPLSCFQTAG